VSNSNLTILLMPLFIPLATGVINLLVPRWRREISIIGTVINLYFALHIFVLSRQGILTYNFTSLYMVNIGLRIDGLAAFVLLASAFLGTLLTIFAYRYMDKHPGKENYYFLILFSLGCADGAFMASDLIVLLFFWGFLAALLYGMLFISRQDSSALAMKAFIINVTADLLLLTGIGLILFGLGDSEIAPQFKIPLHSPISIIAFIFVITGALAKAGTIPFQNWIPDAAGSTPATFLGFILGALDKLLGIYLLTRLSIYVFDITSSMAVRNVIMGIGALTILAAVMMALVQKDIYRLLSFHAISQVGYMILGIGTGTAVGIAGGLFHMLNNAFYKSNLFYTAGSVEHQTGETRLDRLGGLATRMPYTFFSFFISALAISGIPPLNGFVSKWMVYQGVLQVGQQVNNIWPVFLIAAMLGSVLTLASFLKAMHSMFFGQSSPALEQVRETSPSMCVPTVIQAVVCILFGVFANVFPLPLFIVPSLPPDMNLDPGNLIGFWQPSLATGLIIFGIIIGLVIYLFGTIRKPRTSKIFVGGETLSYEEASMPGTEFYSPVKNLHYLKKLYASAEAGATDFYNIGMRTANGVSQFVFAYVDRTVDRFYTVASSIISMFGHGFQAFSTWFFVLLTVPLLIFAGSGNLKAIQILAFILMIGTSLIALVETKFSRFMTLISLTQLGFIILAFGRGEIIGSLAGIFQIYNSGTAYITIFLAYRLLMKSHPGDRIADFHGVSEGMPIATLGFIIGGLALAGMPPSGNFFSKYLLASIYPDNMIYTMIIIFVALLMLGVMLRVISQVFFGKPNADYQEKKGTLYYATLAISILVMFNGILAKPLVDLLSIIFRVAVR
jgi:formate hydrogenlyase subunit 3/multisubunit Na+/H+ antiporter MnhD subunit